MMTIFQNEFYALQGSPWGCGRVSRTSLNVNAFQVSVCLLQVYIIWGPRFLLMG